MTTIGTGMLNSQRNTDQSTLLSVAIQRLSSGLRVAPVKEETADTDCQRQEFV